MRIKNINVLPFKSRVVYEESKTPLTSYEKDYINRFEEGETYDTRFLGEGVVSKAYYSPTCDFVIKQNKYNPYIQEKSHYEMGSLAYENSILLKIDDNVKTTQRGKAYVETAKGGKFLISSYVPGKPANRYTNPFKEKHIDRLLRNLYRLDKSMIIHSDLSNPNLLLDDNNNVNLIDYQWADTYNLSSKRDNYTLRNAFFPIFETPNNASMFEGAALAGYTRPMSISEQNDFLKKYYKNKAEYIDKNVHRIEKYNKNTFFNRLNEALEFEKARVKAYGSMDEYILKAEVLKMNILNLNRRQFSCHDTNKIEPRNILRAIPLTIKAKECAEALTQYTEGYKSDSIYYNYMRKFGEYWQENILKWYPSSLKWIFKLVSGEEKDPGKTFFPEKINEFNNLSIVNGSYSLTVPHKYESDDLELRELFKDAYKYGKNSYFCKKNEAFKIIDKIFKR